MLQGGRAHELARCRIVIEAECNSLATPHVRRRTTTHLQVVPNPSYEEKDGASTRCRFSITRLFSALKEAFGPDEYHPRAASGVLISCVLPCHRAPDGADGSVLRGVLEYPG